MLLSSFIYSGPRRYEWIGGTKSKTGSEKYYCSTHWVNTRDGTGLAQSDSRSSLYDVIRDELLQTTGMDIKT